MNLDFKIYINRWSATSGNGDYYYNLEEEEADEIVSRGKNGHKTINNFQVVGSENPFFGVTDSDYDVKNIGEAVLKFMALQHETLEDFLKEDEA